MNKILIIGAKGFIGQKVLTHFRKRVATEVWGCDVVVDDNDERYMLIDAANSNYHQIFEEQRFDLCINCSGAANVPDSLKRPLRDFTLNTSNVFKILDAIRQYAPSCKFINLSSAAVYGNPERLPIQETQFLKPVSPYGQHKLIAEQICQEFYTYYQVPTCSLRIFSAYGEGLYKQLFWDLYKKAQSKDIISLFGTGDESRDFIHIDDIVQVIALVTEKGDFEGEAINVANGEEIFIKDAVLGFYQNFDALVNHQFSGTERKGDPSNWVADISKIKALGYISKVTFLDGLKRYYKWVKHLE